MSGGPLAGVLALRLPFFYGWVILGCACAAALARSGPAVATLSVFVEPMTREFGWSRTALAGAVSLGGVLAAVLSPAVGAMMDRHGARLIICVAVVTTALPLALLSGIESMLAFYLLYCIARLNFAGPFDLGIHGAVNSWFVKKRAIAGSIVAFAQPCGLIIVPLIAYAAMERGGWRLGWQAVAATVLIVGFVPTFLLMVRRPEDLGLLPDGAPSAPTDGSAGASAAPTAPEPAFTRAEALGTRAFWMLALYTLLVYPVQAGTSLHQAAHLVERGLSQAEAVMCVTTFSATAAIAGLALGFSSRRLGVPLALAVSGTCLAGSGIVLARVADITGGLAGVILFGIGIGGISTVLPISWVDYFGRRNFGAIRGIALTIQVTAQASGPLISGILRDATGDYWASLTTFTVFGALGTVAALLITKPVPRDSASS